VDSYKGDIFLRHSVALRCHFCVLQNIAANYILYHGVVCADKYFHILVIDDTLGSYR